MIFSEEDIDFTSLTSTQFESLCYDVLAKQGFHSLSWRQGGADHGRDIEAQRTFDNPLTGPYSEKWFVECKKWNQGLPVNEISSKVEWAKAESAHHLVVMTSSYLTTDTRTWIEKRLPQCSFRFHEVDGKKLKCILLLPGYDDLIEKWFLSKPEKSFRHKFKDWQEYGLLPDFKVFNFFCENLQIQKLKIDEIAFLWIMYIFRPEGQDELGVAQSRKVYEKFRDENLPRFSISPPDAISALQSRMWRVRKSATVETTYAMGETVLTIVKAWLYSPDSSEDLDTLYFCQRFSESCGIEVLLSRDQYISPQIYCWGFDPVPRTRELLKNLWSSVD
jgi:Restriction endonuclease